MRKLVAVFGVLVLSLMVTPVFADVNNFYFSDFTGDYYLTKDAEGVSHLKVVESVTAEFPNYNQNKGICRQIAFTNQGGKNLTLPSLTRDNLKLTRNGASEPIYSIEKEDGYYNVCTGTDEYVLGTQEYVFEYEFEKVVTDYDSYQELYWDTNGNGARQKFDKVTARLHFEDYNDWTGEAWCYVGAYGEKGQDRCTISEIDDGVEFTASDLARFENLTFDVELKPGSFVVPEPDLNYASVWLMILLAAICGGWLGWKNYMFAQTREKARYYKELFVKPEYQPHDTYTLPEMTEVYFGKKKDVKVAMLLELATKKKIAFQREDKKWKIIVNNLDGVRDEYLKLLAILNGGTTPDAKDVIEIKRRTATSSLISIRESMERKILRDLRQDGLVEAKYHTGAGKTSVGQVIAQIVFLAPMAVMAWFFVLTVLDDLTGFGSSYNGEFAYMELFACMSIFLPAFTVVISVILSAMAKPYIGRTMKGLEAARYMDGLKLYIGMAEAERLKILQSIEGADTSAEGIVKLYEKLLPYAAVFGLEESWMDEMKKYCELEKIDTPDYLMTGITAHELSRGLARASSYATTASTMSSSGGSSSSGFSGGGGGGFSGGGGGGGGFSGR